jgi:cell division protein FtsB
VRINWGTFLSKLFYFTVIAGLAINIYITFEKGLTTAARFEEEQAKLDSIMQENSQLIEQVREYDSLEYKRIYARDNLNLGHANETLYYIDRPEELPEVEPLLEETMRISFSEKESYWAGLLFGY